MLLEAFKIEDVIPKASKPCELFLGRVQPPHNGHARILQGMKNGIVAIVKGVQTSLDKNKNPLPFEYQKRLIDEISPNLPVMAVPTGYLPEIINEIRKTGKEVTKVYAGPDRIPEYKRQLERANATLDDDKQFDVTFEEAERVTSATAVRDAIRSGNETAFRANVPKAIWGEFNTLKGYLNESESGFGRFLIEQGWQDDVGNFPALDAQGIIEDLGPQGQLTDTDKDSMDEAEDELSPRLVGGRSDNPKNSAKKIAPDNKLIKEPLHPQVDRDQKFLSKI